jgi:hypothetical protein
MYIELPNVQYHYISIFILHTKYQAFSITGTYEIKGETSDRGRYGQSLSDPVELQLFGKFLMKAS